MKTNGRIRDLLSTPCLNDIEYGHRVIWPLMDYLGIPPEARRPQFQIENPFGDGLLRLDYLVHHGDVPLVTIEGEPIARQFDIGFRQAKNYSRNFKPRQHDCLMQERTVPFLITAAGNRAEMCRAVVRGLNIEYEPIRQNGLLAFLEWGELLEEAGQLRPAAAVSPRQEVLVADLASQFFTDLFASIDRAASLRNKEDQKIILFNRIVDHARRHEEADIRSICRKASLREGAIHRVLRTIAFTGKRLNRRNSPARQWRAAIASSCFNRLVAERIVILPASRNRAPIVSMAPCVIAMSRGTSPPRKSRSKWSGWRDPARESG